MKQFLENKTVRKIIQIYIGIFCISIGAVCLLAFPFVFFGSIVMLFGSFLLGLALTVLVLPLVGFLAWMGLTTGWKLLGIGEWL